VQGDNTSEEDAIAEREAAPVRAIDFADPTEVNDTAAVSYDTDPAEIHDDVPSPAEVNNVSNEVTGVSDPTEVNDATAPAVITESSDCFTTRYIHLPF
jgi:predicted membrane-bound mannosyltransferase